MAADIGREIPGAKPGSLRQWFAGLDRLLAESARWWQFRPFHHRQWYWRDSQPELCRALDALTDEELASLETDMEAAGEWLSPWLPARQLSELTRLPLLESRELHSPPRLDHGVPGRKWQQILAFAARVPTSDAPLLEWCAGKGHLGRVLAACDGRNVTSLEWQERLCAEGARLARRSGMPMEFVHCDAFAPEAAARVSGHDAVALHACGDLHTTLMRHWSTDGGHSLSLSPCCYHLLRGDEFAPLSETARNGQVKLSRDDLHLPLQETVTAGAGVRRLRHCELHWRMAFDELQREVRGVDEYLPVPNIRKSLLNAGFETFARWAAERKQLALPGKIDEAAWLERGAQRRHRVRRMELVAHVFRRPLELWLVLDRALYLEEQGARVEIGEFCTREITPRNILIRATR
ncbi:methyltransferase [Microbulbifer yueqingensis]|uniref:Methyltransferase domain-containing protein n=1 Tax=Microbulbifer yueqingensis TaxID=658219 RepID=A0A1G8Y2A1_9GAMM|nr:methyltransferase [Microbulbifer yueqingensis]SDJ96180.1 Methyltransferase domain-containing protein [Microbulbifer yueqingensis]